MTGSPCFLHIIHVFLGFARVLQELSGFSPGLPGAWSVAYSIRV